jgi:hypothetical protein
MWKKRENTRHILSLPLGLFLLSLLFFLNALDSMSCRYDPHRNCSMILCYSAVQFAAVWGDEYGSWLHGNDYV